MNARLAGVLAMWLKSSGREHAERYLQTWVAAGLVGEDEAAQWRARFRAASEDDARILSGWEEPAERLLANARRDLAAAARLDEPVAQRAAALPMAINALGILDAGRPMALLKEHYRGAPPPGPPPPDVAERMRIVRERPPAHGAELRRVIVGPPERLDGLRITTVEVYDDMLTVRWHHISTDGSFPGGQKLGDVAAIADDVGTRYYASGGGASRAGELGGEAAVILGAMNVAPAPPPSARELRLERDGRTAVVGL